MHKLRAVGLSNTSIRWFESYLTRTQNVLFDSKLSETQCTKSGIGQGTILGPILFIFYINDLSNVLGGARINMYADDCILYCTGNTWERVHDSLQSDLDKIDSWLTANALRLNAKKSKCLIIASPNKKRNINRNLTLRISAQSLDFVDKFSYLGYYLDTDMSLKPLLSHIKKITTSKLGTLYKVRKYMTIDSALAIYKQMIMPLFDYSGFLLISCNKTDREDLQIIQNNALRCCLTLRQNDRISLVEIHRRAKLVSLEQRRCIQLISLLFLYGKMNPDVVVVPPRNTRAAKRKKYKTAKYENIKYRNSPYYKAAHLWDTMPANIMNTETITELKGLLKKHFSPFDDKYFET